MRVLNIVTSPRNDRSASRAIIDAFLREYTAQADNIVVDTLDVWQERLPGVRRADDRGEIQRGVGRADDAGRGRRVGENPRTSRFRGAERIVMGVPMWNFSFPYKLKQLIDLSCERNMLFTFDGKRCGP